MRACLLTVVVAGLAAGLLPFQSSAVGLAKGGRLPFAAAAGLFQQRGQLGDLRLQGSDLRLQSGHLGQQASATGTLGNFAWLTIHGEPNLPRRPAASKINSAPRR